MEYKLSELCAGITDGSHNPPPSGDKSTFLMLSSKNIFDDYITYEDPRYLSEEQYLFEHKRTNVRPGDVLMTIVGTVGRTAVVSKDAPPITLQRSVAVLHPKKEMCKSRYLMYLLRSKRAFFEAEAHGVAQKGIYLKQLSNITMNVPEVTQQEEIVQLLDKIYVIIQKRNEELSLLDELIKARFVEMFGGEKNLMAMSDICSIITDGTHQPPKFKEDGIPFIFVSNITNDKLTYDAEKFIDQDTYNELVKRTPIEIGDVLLSTVGSYGHPAVVKSDK